MKKVFLNIMLVFTVLAAFSSASLVSAQTCEIEDSLFHRSLLSSIVGIPLTVNDFVYSLPLSGFSFTTGYGITETVKCGSYVSDQLGLNPSTEQGNAYATNLSRCSGTSESTCAEMLNSQPGEQSVAMNWTQFGQTRASGSLMGLAYLTKNFIDNEPLPVNLAFYVDKKLDNIPFNNRAYAQVNYGLPLLQSVFSIWQVFRNIAYGLMSLVLLYVGVLIVLRKRVNPQMIVTVQYSLPKIVIALVLITFSYPIGATLGSLGWVLFRSGGSIVHSIMGSLNIGGITGFNLVNQTLAIYSIIVGVLSIFGGSIVVGVVLVAFLIIFALTWIVFNVKAIMIYINIIFSVLTSPIEFALGAIPGNESRLTDWFLRMFKYMISLFLMGIIVPLATLIALAIAVGYGQELGGFGMLLGSALPLFVLFYAFGIGINIEEKVDVFISGKKKK